MRTEECLINLGDHRLILRNAEESDAEILIEFLKQVCGETKFLVMEPEEVNLTVEEEEAFIRAQNESAVSLMLLAFLDGKYIGNCSLRGNDSNRYRHRASLGIAIYQQYTGMGIGKKMIETLLKIANDKGIEQVELEVVADNERAISLYERVGFEICGTLPHNMKYGDGTYADAYWMVMKISN